MLGIIGGSGLTRLANLQDSQCRVVRTPYGEPSGPLTFGRIGASEVVFVARHGYGHTIPPHLVNYRANIHALHSSGVTRIVAVAAVGGIRGDLAPGCLVVPRQIIDYTWGREMSFNLGSEGRVLHVDFTEPYAVAIRMLLLDAAQRCGEAVIDGGVYAVMQGPRLETAAEIDRLQRDGADMVGMSAMPETVLARELELPYAALCVVANRAAGRGESSHGIDFGSLEAVLELAMARVRRIIDGVC